MTTRKTSAEAVQKQCRSKDKCNSNVKGKCNGKGKSEGKCNRRFSAFGER